MPYAPGIKQKGNRGNPTEQLSAGQRLSYYLQHHKTRRNPTRPHLDLRLGDRNMGLFSWAVPAGVLPAGNRKVLAPQTEIHDYDYGSFSGNIGKGYGAGEVRLQDRGDVHVHKVTPNTLTFTLAHTRVPVRYTLVRMDTERGNEWLLMQKNPKGAPEIGDKPKLRLIRAEDMDSAIDQAKAVQEKLDGAHTIFDVGEHGDIEAYSIRKRNTGDPIVHTERLGLSGHQAKDLAGTRFRGETFGVDTATGKAAPFKDVSGILNATLSRARQIRKERGIDLRVAPFAVTRFKGKDVAGATPDEQRALIEQIVAALPAGKGYLPRRATGLADKRQLAAEIRSGENPMTQEGLVLDMENGQAKIKFRPETTGYLRGTFPGTGRRAASAGGLLASLEPKGEPNIRLGTGFTDAELADIIKNLPGGNMGKPIRINYQEKFPSGKLRAPSFGGFETDKAAGEKEAGLKSRALAAILLGLKPGIARAQQAAPAAINMAEYEISPLVRNLAKVLPNIKMPTPTGAPGYATNAMHQVNMGLAKPIRWAMKGKSQAFVDHYKNLPPSLQRSLDQALAGVARQTNGRAIPPLELGVRIQEAYPALLKHPSVAKLYETDPAGAARLAASMITKRPQGMTKAFAEKVAVIRRNPDTGKYILYTKDGKRILGKHPTVAAAKRQERATQANKHAAADMSKIITKAELAKVDTNPTPAQQEAGNYRKAHMRVHGLDITIENPQGSVRSGVSGTGKKWSTKMHAHYGYIKRTESDADGDHIDVFIGPYPQWKTVFVINQSRPDGKGFDEHKVMMGYRSEADARAGYLANYEKGWKGLGSITSMGIAAFKEWLQSGDTGKTASATVKLPGLFTWVNTR